MNSDHSKINVMPAASLLVAIVVSLCCSEQTVFAQGDFGGLRVPNMFAQPQAGTQTFQTPDIKGAIGQAATQLTNQANEAVSQLQAQAQPVLNQFGTQTFQQPDLNRAVNQVHTQLTNQANEAVSQLQAHAQPVLTQPNSTPPSLDWPDKPVKFDDFVRQTNLEQADASKLSLIHI